MSDRLAPGVRARLHELTPRNASGRLKEKLFQRLTPNFGHPKLREHLGALVMTMKLSESWEQFMGHANRKHLPIEDKRGQRSLRLGEEHPEPSESKEHAMTPTADEQAGIDWLNEQVRTIASVLRLDLQEHKWGQDPQYFDRGEFQLAIKVRARPDTRRVLVFDGDALADCGNGSMGERAKAETRVRVALTEMADIVKGPRAKPTSN